MIGFYQGAQMTLLRAYIGETSATVISTMSPEKRRKSTLKYTNYIITFSVCSLSVLAGPGERGTGRGRGQISGICTYIRTFMCGQQRQRAVWVYFVDSSFMNLAYFGEANPVGPSLMLTSS